LHVAIDFAATVSTGSPEARGVHAERATRTGLVLVSALRPLPNESGQLIGKAYLEEIGFVSSGRMAQAVHRLSTVLTAVNGVGASFKALLCASPAKQVEPLRTRIFRPFGMAGRPINQLVLFRLN